MDSIVPRAPATSFACEGLRKSYEAEAHGHRWLHAVLRDVSLVVHGGRCTAIVGQGLGPVTLLRCMAGLVVPERGALRWRDGSGRITAPPRRALVAAEWRPYECHTVRDVLEQAVPAGWPQRAADAQVADAARRCALETALARRAASMPQATIRLVATAAALVGGARWLLLDRRGAVDAAVDAAAGSAAGGPHACSTDVGAVRLEARVLRRLARDGLTVVAAGPADHCATIAPEASIALAAGRLERRRERDVWRRVAEGEPC